MNGFHPNTKGAALCALITLVLCAGGCKSTSTGVNNPFMAPDRVSPPSTRVIAPGQAQPYYPGDPLPVMQSSTAPPADNALASGTSASALSSTGRPLGWGGANTAVTQNAAPPLAANAQAPWGAKPAAASIPIGNESPVSVPTDGDALRFALPAPTNPETVTPVAAPSPATQPAVQSAATAANQSVMQATYAAPGGSGLTPVVNPPALNPTPKAGQSWTNPVTPAVNSTPANGVLPLPSPPTTAQPQYYALPSNNPVAVQLRAVTPPPPQPGDPAPRIRMPGYETPQTANADGFRPRTSMR